MCKDAIEFKEGMSKYLSMSNYEQKRYSFIAGFFKDKKGKFLDIGWE